MRNLLLLLILISPVNCTIASGEQVDEHAEVKGPNGGKLLEQDGFSVEVTIFESGIPPEMRLFVYQNGQIVDRFSLCSITNHQSIQPVNVPY